MEGSVQPIPDSAVDVLARVFLGAIAVMTVVAVVMAAVVEPFLDSGTSSLLNAVLLFVAISQLVVVRRVVLPGQAKAETPIPTIAILGYAFSESSTIYGLVLVTMSSDAWRMAPFTVIAVLSWLLVYGFVNKLRPGAADIDFPRL